MFAADPFAIRMGIDRENYQWGYRTTHAFAVESRFRSRDRGPGAVLPGRFTRVTIWFF